ncbi:MAG TPA: 16S rRNA (cytosine(967)-C(5))-methyltransferase RsmB [Verrucomicrobiae bacterium]|nr:16S rRNA (cytosine(967)-C(5))-methyltransferase RsmB [Verrucomicrobiae bacterium]
MSAQKPREIAFRVLLEHREGAHFLEYLLERAFAKAPMSPADRALAQELAFGVTRWEKTLDWLIAQKTRERPAKPALEILLRLGLYQLFWLDRIPDHAAVNETVELAKHAGFKSQAGFINAVLRGFLREREITRQKLAELRERNPALGLSHPEWLYRRWQERYGEVDARRLMQWNNQPPPTYARVNTIKTETTRLTEAWKTEGVEFRGCQFDWVPANTVFELLEHPPLVSLKSFLDGGFYVQDPSTLFSVHELAPKPGETILDMCAAPGGKSTYIAALMNNIGKIVATDLSPGRLELVRQNIARLGVTCATIEPWSAAISQSPRASFDRILLDVPCSNTGVMRRRVELRWRIQAEELERLVKEQRDLLEHAAQLIKPGGVIVYSTCSLEPEENVELIDGFLQSHPRFAVKARAGRAELLPFRDGVDGAFTAILSHS